ncbi:Hsp20/alpha crystallin family protein [Gluconacetobacter dulcium]|uniref:Hsp20/alpha crystallin family protein n=1 Tax=Gluconacetobacter dulcium TaxID=2729096 RepID=UPI00287B726E|nr:Hsp20 family protein [Gluconacetobacter dulcium]
MARNASGARTNGGTIINHYSERRFGSFMRSLPIPDGVDATKIDATFDNGLLTITLPKTPEAQKSETIIPVKHA